jgi:hypothetical protein
VEYGQRYCVRCGARRGPLPVLVAERIGALLERGAPLPPGEPAAKETPPAREKLGWQRPLAPGMPTPRVATIAVMGMLAFGVVVGSLARGGVEALASLPQIILNLPSGGSPGNTGGGPSGGSAAAGARSAASGGSAGSSSTAAAAGTGSSAGGRKYGISSGNSRGTQGFNGLPPVGHVFLIVLSGQGYNQTFGPLSTDKYLSKTLVDQGELLFNYYAVAGSSLANDIALLSGQGPTPQTLSDCPAYDPIAPGVKGSQGQVLGAGCIYPASTDTLAGQLTAAHRSWRAYIQGMPRACSHPAVGSGAMYTATLEHPYAAWTNPFVYFESVLKPASACRKDDADLGRLKTDLNKTATTPALAYITADPCDDGRTQPCSLGAPSGLGPADRFLQTIVPEIEHSPAYKSDGLIIVTFDVAPQTGTGADSSSCCGNPSYPNLPSLSATSTTPTTTAPTTPTPTTGTTTTTMPTSTTPATSTPTTTTPSLGTGETNPTGGGGQVGALLISKYVKPNTNDPLDYFNHFSLLAGIEELFGLRRLAYANAPALPVWTASVFNGP